MFHAFHRLSYILDARVVFPNPIRPGVELPIPPKMRKKSLICYVWHQLYAQTSLSLVLEIKPNFHDQSIAFFLTGG